MKIHNYITTKLAALVISLAAPVACFAASNIYFGPTGAESGLSNPDGSWFTAYTGPGPAATLSYDTTTIDSLATANDANGDSTGSMFYQVNWTGNTSSAGWYFDLGWIDDANGYFTSGQSGFDGTQYASIELDFKFDLATFTLSPTSAASLAFGIDEAYAHDDQETFSYSPGGIWDGNWHHLSIPVNDLDGTLTGADGLDVFMYSTTATGEMDFWLANVWLKANVVAPPPPTLTTVTPAIPGLNIFNATYGLPSGAYNNRNEAVSTTTSGLSWVGASGNVTYSFYLAGFPQNAVTTPTVGGAEAYMFLVPNSAAEDNAPDWNEPTCMILSVQSTGSGNGQATLSYKVNSPNIEPSGNIVRVQSSQLLGEYKLVFTGNDAGFVQTPDGTIGSFALNGTDGETYFAETGSESYDFLIYLGSQGNIAAAADQAVVYGSFNVTGVDGGTSASTTFNNIAVPSDALPANWITSGSGPITSENAAVVIVPTTARYWVTWTSPASGFVLQDTPSLSGPNFQEVLTYTKIPLSGLGSPAFFTQLVDAGDLQSPTSAQYFNLAQHSYGGASCSGSLLVAVPGQTVSINHGVYSVSGTPTPLSNGGGNGFWQIDLGNSAAVTNVIDGGTPTALVAGSIYVYALDSAGYLAASVSDGIAVYCNSDTFTGDFIGAGATMSGGIAQFPDTDGISWGNAEPGTLTPPVQETIGVVDYSLQPACQITANMVGSFTLES